MSSKLTCGYSLRGATRIIALTDIVVEIATMVFLIISMVPLVENMKQNMHNGYKSYHHRDSSMMTDVTILALDSSSLLIHIIELLIVILVFQGAQQRNLPKCKAWVRVTEVLTGLDGIIFVAHMIVEFDAGMLIFLIFEFTYKSYSCAVVEAFIKEMRSYDGTPSGGQDAFN